MECTLCDAMRTYIKVNRCSGLSCEATELRVHDVVNMASPQHRHPPRTGSTPSVRTGTKLSLYRKQWYDNSTACGSHWKKLVVYKVGARLTLVDLWPSTDTSTTLSPPSCAARTARTSASLVSTHLAPGTWAQAARLSGPWGKRTARVAERVADCNPLSHHIAVV